MVSKYYIFNSSEFIFVFGNFYYLDENQDWMFEDYNYDAYESIILNENFFLESIADQETNSI